MMGETPTVSSLISGYASRACERMDLELRQEFLQFVKARAHPFGGFVGRADENDLYYTFFGMECMRALASGLALEQTEQFLKSFHPKLDELDLVHLASLIRCWVRFPTMDTDVEKCNSYRWMNRLDRFRCGEGGFQLGNSVAVESIYAGFLALLIHEELQQPLEKPEALLRTMVQFETQDGAYAEGFNLKTGTTTVTSAAAILRKTLASDSCRDLGEWILRQQDESGGFLAMPGAPFADLLSTATSLIALKILGVSLDEIRGKCLDFVGRLWHENGGFRGHLEDSVSDVEYTYYGFVSMGILAGK